MSVAVASLTSLGSLLATSAQASDGSINITGEVKGATCTVNGGTGNTLTVPLSASSTSTLSEAGRTSGRQPFKFTLTGCSTDAGTVKARFEKGITTDEATGQLKLLSSGTTAQNVQMRLLNEDDSVIKVGDDSTIKGAKIVGTGAELNYKVEYVATGAATAGTADSSVTYSIIYE